MNRQGKILMVAAMWLSQWTYAQLPQLTYSRQKAILEVEIEHLLQVDSVKLHYYPVVGGSPVSQTQAPEEGRFAFELDLRTTQMVTLTLLNSGPDVQNQPSALVLLTPGERTLLRGDGEKYKNSPANKMWKASGGNDAFNTDLANVGWLFRGLDLFKDLRGPGLIEMRGKTMTDYRHRLDELLTGGVERLKEVADLSPEYLEYQTVQYYLMYGIMLAEGQNAMRYANGGEGDFTPPADYYDHFLQREVFRSNACQYGLFGVAALEVRKIMEDATGEVFPTPEAVAEMGKAQELVQQLEAYRVLTEEQQARLGQDVPTYEDLISSRNHELAAWLESLETESGCRILSISDTLSGEAIFEEIVKPFRGRPVLVDFWATWCGPCRQAMKTILPLKEEVGEKVAFVYVSSPTSPKPAWNAAIPAIQGSHFYVTAPQWSALLKQFRIEGIPAYVIVDSVGKIGQRYIGFPGVDKLREELSKAM